MKISLKRKILHLGHTDSVYNVAKQTSNDQKVADIWRLVQKDLIFFVLFEEMINISSHD